jgi:hypothetical protein
LVECGRDVCLWHQPNADTQDRQGRLSKPPPPEAELSRRSMIVPNSGGYPLRSFRGLGRPLIITSVINERGPPCNRGTLPGRFFPLVFAAYGLPTRRRHPCRRLRQQRTHRSRLHREVHRIGRDEPRDLAGSHFARSPAQRRHKLARMQRGPSRNTTPKSPTRVRIPKSIWVCDS